jgi:gluconolactonase
MAYDPESLGLRRPFKHAFVLLAGHCLILSQPHNLRADSVASGDPRIVSPNATLERVYYGGPGYLDGGGGVTEGCACAPDGSIFFSDITFTARGMKLGAIEAGHIWRYDPRTGMTAVYRSPSGMSNGIKFDARGQMIVAEGADYGGRRISRTDLVTGKSYIVAGLYAGRPFNAPNDISIDEKGRIYFSDPRYLGHEPVEQPAMAVYRIDPDGSVHRIISDAGKPNGVCVAPDQRTLYVVSNDNGSTELEPSSPPSAGRMALLAYDLKPDGTATFRKMLVDYHPHEGPDGLVADKDGNLYVAVRAQARRGVVVYSPDGTELAHIKTEIPTNVCFGRGPSSKMLYITAGRSLYRIKVNKEGYHLPPETR